MKGSHKYRDNLTDVDSIFPKPILPYTSQNVLSLTSYMNKVSSKTDHRPSLGQNFKSILKFCFKWEIFKSPARTHPFCL